MIWLVADSVWPAVQLPCALRSQEKLHQVFGDKLKGEKGNLRQDMWGNILKSLFHLNDSVIPACLAAPCSLSLLLPGHCQSLTEKSQRKKEAENLTHWRGNNYKKKEILVSQRDFDAR